MYSDWCMSKELCSVCPVNQSPRPSCSFRLGGVAIERPEGEVWQNTGRAEVGKKRATVCAIVMAI